ncbi:MULTISPECIES: glycosyl hydrolase family 18 protein [Leptospira]|uniref:glycosyl hydrolase family 18 protein n=1 Tax=Leptospira TaxID=171 RepID=UPI0002976AA9|nr:MULTISPECIES: glycosyl hydrolase family 18 protein [Leptospira]AXX16984.1 glycosyl hydrolase [Leptospira borgpetersenii serovar Ceylonica]EKQ93713.1 glycosyl hydrolase, family 18 domain protein [Leptospira borgpetersenii str. UI 09149]EMK12068.1 glycosyl hydrolase, family 18 domain protein [Leptospira sp. serovar Kenya str. Sh9]EMN13177.1 glycosyl hydrolase, family 18 domain protein [Leptospira borgpetersenii str. Brem 307]MDQ7243372.1 glycosyl hydrolase family 18 protein [Leptospira borgpe
MSILKFFIVLSLIVGNPLWGTDRFLYWNYASIERYSTSDWVGIFSKSHTICYTGSIILSNGDFKPSPLPKNFVDLSRNYQIRLIPLISAISKNNSSFLKSNITIKIGIQNLIHFLEQNPEIAGLHLDIEFLSKSEIPSYRKFIQMLKQKLPKEKVLTIAIFPQLEFPNRNLVIHSDLFQEKSIDEFVLMSYDFHSPKTNPGPVTSISLTKKNLEFLLKRIPSSKLWLGLPLYGYFWSQSGKVKILTQNDYRKFKENSEIIPNEDGFTVLKNENGIGYISDLNTLEKYKKLTQSYRLKGNAFWRIGF